MNFQNGHHESEKIKEPFSTFSNIFYVAAASIIAGRNAGFELLTLPLLILALSSLIFHASGSERNTPAHRADEASIYGVLAALVYYAYNESFFVLILLAIGLTAAFLNLRVANLFALAPIAAIVIAIGLTFYAPLVELGALCVASAATMLLRAYEERLDHGRKRDVLHAVWHLSTAAIVTIAALLIIEYR